MGGEEGGEMGREEEREEGGRREEGSKEGKESEPRQLWLPGCLETTQLVACAIVPALEIMH